MIIGRVMGATITPISFAVVSLPDISYLWGLSLIGSSVLGFLLGWLGDVTVLRRVFNDN